MAILTKTALKALWVTGFQPAQANTDDMFDSRPNLHIAAVAPTVNDDSDDGHAQGDLWLDTTGPTIYFASDVTVGAAVWTDLSSSGSGDVSAAAVMGDHRLIRGDGGAKGVQDSGVTIDDTDNMSGIGNITLSGTVDGRDVAGDGTKLDGVEASADVTDAANVDAAGAIMDADIGANGLMTRTGAGSYTNRSIAVSDARLTVSNGDGVAGNPTVGFGSVAMTDLSDVAAKTGTGTTAVMQDSPTLTTPTLTLKQGATPVPTAEGDIQWDTDGDQIKVGDGVATKTFSDDNAIATGAMTLTNKAMNAANNTFSNFAHGAEVDEPSSGVHGVAGSIVGTTDVQTLTNKTLTTPTIGDLSNATHNHQNAAGGSQISLTAAVTGTLPVANGGTNRTAAPKHPLLLTAAGGMGTATGGAGDANKLPEQAETTTNKVNYHFLAFATGESAFWNVVMPENWDGGTMTAIFYWTAPSGTNDLKWEIKGRAFADSDALDQALGTPATVEDTLLTNGDVHESAATAAMTLAGAPAAGEYCVFEVKRTAPAGTDLVGDAHLLGVKLEYTAAGYSES